MSSEYSISGSFAMGLLRIIQIKANLNRKLRSNLDISLLFCQDIQQILGIFSRHLNSGPKQASLSPNNRNDRGCLNRGMCFEFLNKRRKSRFCLGEVFCMFGINEKKSVNAVPNHKAAPFPCAFSGTYLVVSE